MRDNKIDMWIHVIRPWIPDPLAYEFGSNFGVFILTDRGGDRIERAVFDSEVQDSGVFDIIGGRADALDLQNYYLPKDPEKAPETELDYRFKGLREFVAERNPQRIAVNYSEKLALAEGSEVRPLTDGISHTDYLQLVKALGDKYAKRIVSAEYLIIDYLSRRVKKEVELNRLMGLKATKYLDREFAKIKPGVTTLKELSQNVFVRDPDGNESANDDHVLRGGDLVTILYGAGDMRRIMDADVGGIGYVLRQGDMKIPIYHCFAFEFMVHMPVPKWGKSQPGFSLGSFPL